MKIANPLYYPLSVLAGVVILAAGVRLLKLSNWVVVPAAIGVAATGASLQKQQESRRVLQNPALERELQTVRQQASQLVGQATHLRTEATRLLTEANQMDLLTVVHFACDRALELPAQIDQLANRLHGADSLLDVDDLQAQLAEVERRLSTSSGTAREKLNSLASSLQRNIQLAQQGQDARQAQVVSLSGLILDAAGVLQSMQNQLRATNLADGTVADELRSLSEDLCQFQATVELLMSR